MPERITAPAIAQVAPAVIPAAVFLVIYALNVIGISPSQFGLLVGVQSATAIACYLPVARLADDLGST